MHNKPWAAVLPERLPTAPSEKKKKKKKKFFSPQFCITTSKRNVLAILSITSEIVKALKNYCLP
jgi:hypothetical protein